jgi:hypothetical protein
MKLHVTPFGLTATSNLSTVSGRRLMPARQAAMVTPPAPLPLGPVGDLFTAVRFGEETSTQPPSRRESVTVNVLKDYNDKKLFDLQLLTKRIKEEFPEDPIPKEFIEQHQDNKPLQEGYAIIKQAIRSYKSSDKAPDAYAHHLRDQIEAYYQRNKDQHVDIRSVREALLSSGAIRWDELKKIAADPAMDFRMQALEKLGINRLVDEHKWAYSTGSPKIKSVFSDLDLIASSPEDYRALTEQLEQQGYKVQRVMASDKHTVLFHQVPELDLTLWPVTNPKNVFHQEIGNAPADRQAITMIPSLEAIGYLSKAKFLFKKQLNKLSPAQLNQYIRDLAKTWYKFSMGITRLDNLPPTLPDVEMEQVNLMRRVVDYDISAMEAIDIRLKQRVGADTWYNNRNKIITGILNTQRQLSDFITPYLKYFSDTCMDAIVDAHCKSGETLAMETLVGPSRYRMKIAETIYHNIEEYYGIPDEYAINFRNVNSEMNSTINMILRSRQRPKAEAGGQTT